MAKKYPDLKYFRFLLPNGRQRIISAYNEKQAKEWISNILFCSPSELKVEQIPESQVEDDFLHITLIKETGRLITPSGGAKR